jgi:hypothetical protein
MGKPVTLLSLPSEVLELILGAVSFVDLPYFISASKDINVSYAIDYTESRTALNYPSSRNNSS